jgi:hypothetical protein
MKREAAVFLRKLVLFALPLLVLLGYVEVRLRGVPSYYAIKRACLEQQLGSVEVLVLGSSHAHTGVDPSRFSRPAFNLAFGGQSLYYDTRLVLKYIDRMPRLMCVLIEINYFNLWCQVADSREPWRDYCYYHLWGIRYRNLAWLDPRKVSYIAMYGRDVTLDYARRKFDVELEPEPLGWLAHDTFTVPDVSGDRAKRKIAATDSTMKPTHLPENLLDLGTLLGELRRRHIMAVFFSIPVPESYSRYTSPAINLRSQQAIDSLCLLYGCRYADYSRDQRFDVTDFFDIDHLNARGARKFSTILDRDFIAGATEPRARNGGTAESPAGPTRGRLP